MTTRTYIKTFVGGVQLRGTDVTTVVRNSTPNKLKRAKEKHIERLNKLKTTKPILNEGYDVRVDYIAKS